MIKLHKGVNENGFGEPDAAFAIMPAAELIAEELSDLFWLIFWFGIFGAFKSTVEITRK